MKLIKRIMTLVAVAALPGAAMAQSAGSSAAAQPRVESQAIPRTVFLSNMDLEFRKMDADHNGVLTKKEAQDYEISKILLAAQARKRQLFAALDTDHNGVISPAEFARLPMNEPAPNPQAMIQRFDTNHDNAISLVEYRAGTLANFDRLDVDKDGVVTPAEMKAAGIGNK